MTRLVNRIIPPPVLDAQKAPRSFRWAGQVVQVAQVLDCWVDAGAWWEGEPEKTFWRILSRDGGVYELWHEAGTGKWAVYRIWD